MAGESDNSKTLELRARFRAAERDASRLRLLQAVALTIAQQTDLREALRSALNQAMLFLAVDAGALLRLDAGGLVVQASSGASVPVGARVPLAGALGAALKVPVQIRERAVTPLRVGRGAVALEVLVPLQSQGEALGLLALSSARPIAPPDDADLTTLQALAGLLATATERRPAARSMRGIRREAASALARLTPRERQVLALLPRGFSNAELAGELGVAMGTAKTHVERILHKLGLKDRTQAAVRAAEWGMGK